MFQMIMMGLFSLVVFGTIFYTWCYISAEYTEWEGF